MSLESSLEALAKALGQHAAAMSALADAINAAPMAANSERFKSDSAALEREAETLTPKSAPAAKAAPKKAAPAAKAEELAGNWEPGGGAEIEKGIPLKPNEDPADPPFEDFKPEKDLPKDDAKPDPVAERAEISKKVEESPERPQRTLESARQIASSILKKKGADKLRSLLDEVGVKKLSALNAEQINAFCANAEKALAEA